MQVIGIVAEYNPFHTGHAYQIAQARAALGTQSAVVAVMSGNWVQQADCAIAHKWLRARLALMGGADLVLELPTAYATRSAEGFARAGVQLLEATGVVERLAFGTECADLQALTALAGEIKAHQREIAQVMKTGCSYPAARRKVIDSPLLDTPNNILALEYMECTQLPCTCVQRLGLGHDTADPLYSASAIRATLPAEAIYSIEHCQRAVLAVLRRMEVADWATIDDVTDGLENRLARAAQSATSLEELYTTIKTKRYTHARIRRIVLRAYLGIGKGDYPATPPYLRVLGFNAAGKALLQGSAEDARRAQEQGHRIDQLEREIESLCLKLLLQQQPVARDLRVISAALKMITDMERIGDQAEDIAEIITTLGGRTGAECRDIRVMAEATIKMVTDSVDAYVRQDLSLARAVIEYDDVVDEAFCRVKGTLIAMIAQNTADGEYALDLLMIAKYFERIGDHAVNIAEWVEFSVTGEHKSDSMQ